MLLLSPLLALYVLAAMLGPSFVEHSDEPTYLFYAHQLLDGRYAVHDTPIDARYLWTGPGLPLAMAPFVAAGVPLVLTRLLGALFMFGSVLVFHRLLRRFVSTRTAVIGAVALGLYVPFLVVVARLLTEPLSLLALLAGLLFAVRYVRGGAAWELGVAGLALGYLALTRVAYGYVLTAMLVGLVAWWLWRRGDDLRRWALVCGVALAFCVPWLAYTHSVTGQLFYWGNSGSQNLYWIASPSPGNHGDWRAPTDPMAPADRAFIDRLRPLDPLERDLEMRRKALRNVRHHPGTYAAHVAANVGRMILDVPHSYRAGDGKRALLYAVPNLALILALGLAVWRGRQRPFPRELSVLAMLAAIVFGFHALLAGEPRMVTLIIPIAILLAAWRLDPTARGQRVSPGR